MNKKWLSIALLGLMTLGTTGSLWAEARCLSSMSQSQSSCCCPNAGNNKNHCPAPAKQECPMLIQTAAPAAAIAPLQFAPHFELVSFGKIETDVAQPDFSFESDRPLSPTFRIDRLKKSIPQFRAPPVSPVAV